MPMLLTYQSLHGLKNYPATFGARTYYKSQFVHTNKQKQNHIQDQKIIWTGVHELDNQLTEDEEIRITFANAHNHFQYDLPAQLASKLDKLLTSSQISCRKFLPLEKWARELQDYFPAIEDLTTHELWHDLVLAGLIQI